MPVRVMRVPFTEQQFLDVFVRYNTSLFPALIVAYVLGVLALVMVPARSRAADGITSAVLALMWGWTGGAYHMAYFASVTPVAYGYGGLFVVQGLAFLFYGTILGRISYAYRPGVREVIGAALVFYAMVVYPIVGLVTGHRWTEIPMFGVVPCPTTIFSFGMLMCTERKVPWLLVVIPLLWAILGSTAALLFGVVQDWGLIVSAVLFVLVNLRRRS